MPNSTSTSTPSTPGTNSRRRSNVRTGAGKTTRRNDRQSTQNSSDMNISPMNSNSALEGMLSQVSPEQLSQALALLNQQSVGNGSTGQRPNQSMLLPTGGPNDPMPAPGTYNQAASRPPQSHSPTVSPRARGDNQAGHIPIDPTFDIDSPARPTQTLAGIWRQDVMPPSAEDDKSDESDTEPDQEEEQAQDRRADIETALGSPNRGQEEGETSGDEFRCREAAMAARERSLAERERQLEASIALASGRIAPQVSSSDVPELVVERPRAFTSICLIIAMGIKTSFWVGEYNVLKNIVNSRCDKLKLAVEKPSWAAVPKLTVSNVKMAVVGAFQEQGEDGKAMLTRLKMFDDYWPVERMAYDFWKYRRSGRGRKRHGLTDLIQHTPERSERFRQASLKRKADSPRGSLGRKRVKVLELEDERRGSVDGGASGGEDGGLGADGADNGLTGARENGAELGDIDED